MESVRQKNKIFGELQMTSSFLMVGIISFYPDNTLIQFINTIVNSHYIHIHSVYIVIKMKKPKISNSLTLCKSSSKYTVKNQIFISNSLFDLIFQQGLFKFIMCDGNYQLKVSNQICTASLLGNSGDVLFYPGLIQGCNSIDIWKGTS